jgi:serine-type D-Ala-D-Ala carboxypeptidase/endopeptidase (penicillin-binding protein 4)
MTRRLFSLLFLLAFISTLQAAPKSSLSKNIDAILAKYKVKKTSAGILITSPKEGSVYYALNPDTPRIPASNMKLFTTAVALDVMGPDYVFTTPLTLVGDVKEGVLHGHIWVSGRGDPTISERFHKGDRYRVFKQWADLLIAKGIKRVTGSVVGDDNYFDDQVRNPDWDEGNLGEWFGAPVSALSFNDNCVDVYWKAGKKIGSKARYSINPNLGALIINNRVKTVRYKRGVSNRRYYHMLVGTPTTEVRGSIRSTRKRAVCDVAAISNPTLFFAAAFTKVLRDKGIKVDGPPLDNDDAEIAIAQGTPVRRVSTARSPKLSSIVYVTNHRSQNFYAEMLLKCIGRVVNGTGSFQDGAEVVSKFMTRWKIAGNGFHQADGSGLAKSNRVTPRQFVALLRVMKSHPHGKHFWSSLPQGSKKGGSMHYRLQQGKYQQRLAPYVWAKTGSVNGVRALSGICRPKKGKPFNFSIILNDLPKRGLLGNRAIDEIIAAAAKAI